MKRPELFDRLKNPITKIITLVLVVAYLISFLVIEIVLMQQRIDYPFANELNHFRPMLNCICVGGIGGVLYCLRAIYLNACVKDQWSTIWLPWYFIRPIVSLICGGISWLFLNAGLLVLVSDGNTDSSTYGFLAVAFIAGYNVDKFLSKLEDLSQSRWGISKTRSVRLKEESEKKQCDGSESS